MGEVGSSSRTRCQRRSGAVGRDGAPVRVGQHRAARGRTWARRRRRAARSRRPRRPRAPAPATSSRTDALERRQAEAVRQPSSGVGSGGAVERAGSSPRSRAADHGAARRAARRAGRPRSAPRRRVRRSWQRQRRHAVGLPVEAGQARRRRRPAPAPARCRRGSRCGGRTTAASGASTALTGGTTRVTSAGSSGSAVADAAEYDGDPLAGLQGRVDGERSPRSAVDVADLRHGRPDEQRDGVRRSAVTRAGGEPAGPATERVPDVSACRPAGTVAVRVTRTARAVAPSPGGSSTGPIRRLVVPAAVSDEPAAADHQRRPGDGRLIRRVRRERSRSAAARRASRSAAAAGPAARRVGRDVGRDRARRWRGRSARAGRACRARPTASTSPRAKRRRRELDQLDLVGEVGVGEEAWCRRRRRTGPARRRRRRGSAPDVACSAHHHRGPAAAAARARSSSP